MPDDKQAIAIPGRPALWFHLVNIPIKVLVDAGETKAITYCQSNPKDTVQGISEHGQ
jgi:hypothetical protein